MLDYETKVMLRDVEDFTDIDYIVDCLEDEELKEELQNYAYVYYYKKKTAKEIAQLFLEDYQ